MLKKILMVGAALVCVAGMNSKSFAGEWMEIGAGAGLPEGKEIEAIFRLDGGLTGGEFEGLKDLFVIVRVKAEGGVKFGEGVEFLDFHVSALGLQNGNEYFRAGITFLNVDIQRDVTLGNGSTARLTFVGIKLDSEIPMTHELNLVLNAAADFGGMGWARRTDGTGFNGIGAGAGAEVGVEYLDAYRVAFGAKTSWVGADPWSRETGRVICDRYRDYDYYDDYDYGHYDGGYYDDYYYGGYTRCYDETEGGYYKNSSASQLYLSLTAKLTESLSVFGKAAYNIYSMTDDLGRFNPSDEAGWRFMVGVAVKLR